MFELALLCAVIVGIRIMIEFSIMKDEEEGEGEIYEEEL